MTKPDPFASRMLVHVDHELSEFLRVARLIQSGAYAGSEVDAPLREAFASHFRKLSEFFGVRRIFGTYKDAKAVHYVPTYLARNSKPLQLRMHDADKLQAHLSDGRKKLESKRRSWGSQKDSKLFLAKIRRFVKRAGQRGYDLKSTRLELGNAHWLSGS